ncbi:MAG: site-specific tyrosine recombinase/integron integrase [bacterium]
MDLEFLKEKISVFLVFLEVEKNSSPNTLRAYKIDLEQLILFFDRIGSKEPELKDSFEKILRRYIVFLFYKKISKATLARKLSCFRSFQHFLKMNGIKVNINFKSPKIERKLPTILTVDEIFYLLDSVKNDDLPTKFPNRDKAIFELIYATGVRCSELVGMRLLDIDFINKAVKVLGKGAKERIVLFGNKAKDSVKKYLDKERGLMIKKQDPGYLFLNASGNKLTPRSVQRVFEMFRKFLKIDKNLTPHKVRHSFATHLLNQGVDLRIIQELLGHKNLGTTEIYTRVTSAELAKMCDESHPLNKMGGLLFEDKE